MNSRYQSFILISFILVSVISCGGGGGAPGSDFSNTAIMIKSALLTVTSPDIDTYWTCCTTDATTGLCSAVEGTNPFVRTDAVLAVSTQNLSPTITSDHFPAKIQQCTIEYLKSNEDPAAPILDSMTIYPECILKEGDNTCAVTLMDQTRKRQYSVARWTTSSDFVGGPPSLKELGQNIPAQSPSHYVARMMCTYTNNFGKSGTFEAAIDIWLADFLNC